MRTIYLSVQPTGAPVKIMDIDGNPAGAPAVGDVVRVQLPEGKLVFKVMERTWSHSASESEEVGVISYLTILMTQIAVEPNPESTEQ